MEQLVRMLETQNRVVFITGAGCSVHSGIPPYRGSDDAVWSNFVTAWATRKTFLNDPVEWYNSFYLATHFKEEYLKAEPNRGHDALSFICKRFPMACVITQNVDGLHTRGSGKIDDSQLIEVHGSMHGGWKCIQDDCEYATHCIEENEVDFAACGEQVGSRPGEPNFKLRTAPTCPKCTNPLLPQCLLFDEQYSSHPFYEWDAASDWMEDACAMVFVGTSFSVGLTQIALETSRKKPAALFNINLNSMEHDMRTVDSARMFNILGPSEQILPLLAHVVSKRRGNKEDEEWNQFAPVHSVWKRTCSSSLSLSSTSSSSSSSSTTTTTTCSSVGSLVRCRAVPVHHVQVTETSSTTCSSSTLQEDGVKSRDERKRKRKRNRSTSRSATFDANVVLSSGCSSSASSWTDMNQQAGKRLKNINLIHIEKEKNTLLKRKQAHPKQKNKGLMLLMLRGVWMTE